MVVVNRKGIIDKKSYKPKRLECYYCGGALTEEELVIKKIPLVTKSGVRNYKRNFHLRCVPEIISERSDEVKSKNEDYYWDKCYFYAKELMELPDGKDLEQHFVMRIRGARVGKFYPNGTNVKGLKRGYDYETILTTMKFCSGSIRKIVATQSFESTEHKINYIMAIITNNLNFISSKVEANRKMKSKLSKVEFESPEKVDNVAEYVAKGNVKNDKIGNIVEELKKSKNSEDDDFMSEFV